MLTTRILPFRPIGALLITVKGKSRPFSLSHKKSTGNRNHNIEREKTKAFDYSAKVTCEFANESPFAVHAIWLRHHCQCEKCYNHSTNQRTMIPSDLPKTSVILKAFAQNNELVITWNDGHVSKFTKNWLVNNAPVSSFENRDKLSETLIMKNHQNKNLSLELIFGDGKYKTEKRNPIDTAIPYDDFMKDGTEGVANLLSNIIQHGFGIVNECPPDFETTKKVISKVSHPQNTIYGDFSEWTSNLAHADTAYTSDIVHLHTDTTYFTEPIGLQIFHCLKHDGTGGMNWLADGFSAARKIAETRPELYSTLARYSIPSQYIDLGKHNFCSNDVTVGHDKISGRIQKIRYNPHDMATLSNIPQEHVPEFYESLVYLSDLLESNPIEIKLTPGLVIFLDNWRILHGRAAFTGFRHLCGAYISRSDWLSKAKTLKVLE